MYCSSCSTIIPRLFPCSCFALPSLRDGDVRFLKQGSLFMLVIAIARSCLLTFLSSSDLCAKILAIKLERNFCSSLLLATVRVTLPSAYAYFENSLSYSPFLEPLKSEIRVRKSVPYRANSTDATSETTQ